MDEARARMRLNPRSKQTVCPYSGIVADDEDFLHPEDREAAIETAKHAMMADVHEHLAKMFDGLNRSFGRNSPVQIKTTVDSTPRPRPHFHRSDLLRELICDHCSRDYGVYAIALFCPDCGAPNLRLHYAREADLVRTQVSLAEAQDDDTRELAYRLLGNAHEDVLTAFEATLKCVYLHGLTQRSIDLTSIKPVRNDFQNIDNGRRRFAQLEMDPYACLSGDDLAALSLNIQKRHVIGHNLGVVDAKFAQHADDARIGETVRLVGEDIRTFAGLAQRVIDSLDAWLGGGRPAPTMQLLEPATPSEAPMTENAPTNAREQALEALDLALSPLARRAACLLAEKSVEGMDIPQSTSTLSEVMQGVSIDDLSEAIAELEMDGFLRTEDGGDDLPDIVPALDLYATFDKIAVGTDPTSDSVALARIVVAAKEDLDVAKLDQQMGWPRRRFNPALSLVLAQLNEERVDRSLGDSYPALYANLLPADRVSLKRYIARHER